MSEIAFHAVVSKIVRTKSDKGTTYKVHLNSIDGHKVMLDFGEEEPRGYRPQQDLTVKIENPQTLLDGKERE